MTGYLQVTAAGWILLSFGHTVYFAVAITILKTLADNFGIDVGERLAIRPKVQFLTCNCQNLRKGRLVSRQWVLHHERSASLSTCAIAILRLTLAALLNYAWSQNPALLSEPVHRAIAALMVSIIGISSAWYGKQRVMPNAFATGMVAILQGYAAFLA